MVNKLEKSQKIRTFDPNGVGGVNANIFGLPFTPEESDVVIIPVPWEVTVSNGEGTSEGPANILAQSPQIDLFDEVVTQPWKAGIAMEEISEEVKAKNDLLRPLARNVIRKIEDNPSAWLDEDVAKDIVRVNQGCSWLESWVYERSIHWLSKGKYPVVVGGDHSTPLGLLKALAGYHTQFGVLHIDAHADLRQSYMGFTHSHASIMHQAAGIKHISSVVQVGLRDICEQEADFQAGNEHRFFPFFDRDIRRRCFLGESWNSICTNIISKLPHKVHISLDIDGLDPSLCPGTGTPVPGGLLYNEVLFLFELLVRMGKTIVGFDLVETGKHPSDGIVACRLLYKTIALLLKSNNRIR